MLNTGKRYVFFGNGVHKKPHLLDIQQIFARKMIHFADILPDIPETETIKKLWHLLEILLPYIARSEYRNDGWDLSRNSCSCVLKMNQFNQFNITAWSGIEEKDTS